MSDSSSTFNIQVSPRGYDALFAEMLGYVSPGEFYDTNLGYPMVVWSSKNPNFIFTTNNLGVPIQITTQKEGPYHPSVNPGNRVTQVQFIPQNATTSFSLTMGLGLNKLIATEMIPGGRTFLVEVQASPNTTIFEAFGREVFNSVNIVNEQKAALFSPYSTRLADQVIQFQSLLPSVQSLKIISTRMLIRGAVHFPGEELGVQNLIQSFSFNTPAYATMRSSSTFHLERSRIQRSGENLAGMEAHVWFPNLAVTQWLAFLKMADSLNQNYVINSIQDDLVSITYKGRTQLHQFNFDAPGSNFLTSLSTTDCFNNLDLFISTAITSNLVFDLWSYPFDMEITAATPIGRDRVSFDEGVLLDQGLNFDGDSIDPYNDGWVGFSFDGRFEADARTSEQAQLGLDSGITPDKTYSGSATVYPHGPYTQMFNSHRTWIPIPYLVTATGTLDDYTGDGVIVGIDMPLPISPQILQAGTAYPVYVKYADSNDMTVPSGIGTVTIQESNGGAVWTVPVTTNGYQTFNLTPTQVGEISWTLSDGTYTDQSMTAQVVAGPFSYFILSAIGNQSVGVPFNVTIQCADQYGNPTTYSGDNTNVAIDAQGGFAADALSPQFCNLVNGMATISLTMSEAGTGNLLFQLGSAQATSNDFSVS
jgi:hypothetical protein